MKNLKIGILTLVMSAFVLSTNNYAQCGSKEDKKSDIVDLAIKTEFLSTLVAAVQAGELVGTLKSDGPFTVFAPTNEAFEALPEGTLEMLLKPENRDKLVTVLTYHVIPGEVKSTDLKDGMMAETVEGSKIKVNLSDKGAKINDAMVTSADIMADNGVVHVIDQVIIPPTFEN